MAPRPGAISVSLPELVSIIGENETRQNRNRTKFDTVDFAVGDGYTVQRCFQNMSQLLGMDPRGIRVGKPDVVALCPGLQRH
jgi:hypothetical protein